MQILALHRNSTGHIHNTNKNSLRGQLWHYMAVTVLSYNNLFGGGVGGLAAAVIFTTMFGMLACLVVEGQCQCFRKAKRGSVQGA